MSRRPRSQNPAPLILFILLCCLAILPHSAAPAQSAEMQLPPIAMTGPPVTYIAIPDFERAAGSTASLTGDSLESIIYNDLEMFSDFNRSPSQTFVNETHRRDQAAASVNFAEWRRIRSNFLLKGTYNIRGNTISADCILYDVDNGRRVFARRYSDFPLQDPRRLAHRISDEIVKEVFNKPGIANTRIVFSSARNSIQEKEIYVMDADGHNVRRLTFDNSIAMVPRWGKNATEIYFTSYRDRYPDLCGVQLFGGQVWYISRRDGGNISPSWCPINERIALTLGRDGNSEIYTMDRSGQERTLQRLTRHPGIDSSPVWSPTGREIAFASDRTGSNHIYIMNTDGTNLRRLTFSGTYNVSPSWSPKGDKIAFAARDRGVFDIYTINVDGTGLYQLTAPPANDEDPSWAPDGEHLTFASNRTGRYQIYIMRADGEKQRALTQGGLENKSPAWSPLLP